MDFYCERTVFYVLCNVLSITNRCCSHFSGCIRISRREVASSFEGIHESIIFLYFRLHRQCLVNTTDGVGLPKTIILEENNFAVTAVVVGAVFLEFSTQSYQFCSETASVEVSFGFEQP